MKSIILDTDVLINFLRGRERARNYLMSVLDTADLCCSALTVAEIHAGMREYERTKTMALLDSLTIIDVTKNIAEKAGEDRRSIKSQDLELDDCIIAATAFMRHAALATGNDRHYPMADIEIEVVKA